MIGQIAISKVSFHCEVVNLERPTTIVETNKFRTVRRRTRDRSFLHSTPRRAPAGNFPETAKDGR